MSEAEAKSSKILVVDDHYQIQRLCGAVLQRCGHKVVICSEIEEAVNMARKVVPNLIVLDFKCDIYMNNDGPGIREGLMSLALIQQQSELKGVPIVMMSANDGTTTRPRVLAAGAAGYLEKPFSRQELTQTISELLNQKLPG
ncbi:MAG: response regulator [Negativicutes bacterium]|nr:response regulator [Negativicutes bacterium]